MFSLIQNVLQGPAKGPQQFSTKSMLNGNYSVEIIVNNEKQENIWQGQFKLQNGTSNGTMNLVKPVETIETVEKKVKGKMTQVENKKVTYEPMNQTHQVQLFAESNTQIKIVIDDQVFLDANLSQNKEENVFKYEQQNETHYIQYVIYNGLYSALTVTNKETKDTTVYNFKKQREQIKQNKWMMILQPLIMIGTQLLSQQMKKKQQKQFQDLQEKTEQQKVGKEEDNMGEKKEEKKEEKSKKEVQAEKKAE